VKGTARNDGQSASESCHSRDGNVQDCAEKLRKGVVRARVEPVGKTISMSPATYHRTLLQEKFARAKGSFRLASEDAEVSMRCVTVTSGKPDVAAISLLCYLDVTVQPSKAT
jgi:hypothetical protein